MDNNETQPTEQVTKTDKIKTFFNTHRGTIIKVAVGVTLAGIVAGGVYLAVRASGEADALNEAEEAYRKAEEAIMMEAVEATE